MLVSLALAIILSAVALFLASFLSWMIFQLHKKDWTKLEREDEFLAAVGPLNVAPGSYMFPGCKNPSEMQTEEFKKKYEAGPRGVMTVFPKVNMGQNLGLTFVYFLVVSTLLGYLATIAFDDRNPKFLDVFRFVYTAGFMTFLAAMVQHSIWFRSRIVGHVIESFVYAAIPAALFAAFWPT